MSRVDQLRSEMAAALAEAEAQEAYEELNTRFRQAPDDEAVKAERQAAAERLQAVRAQLRTVRASAQFGEGDAVISPAPIIATTKVKEGN